MKQCKKYFRKCLAAVLALSMMLGMTTISWAGPTSKTQKKDLVIYFANWDVYNSDYGQVKDLPWDKVTYINHAFWEIEPVDGGYIIQSTDEEADITNGEKAHFTQYEEYTKKYPDVNVMISVGGWTRCGYFSEMANTSEGRASFIQSCIDTMDKYPWVAGIDVDWEYPGVARDSEGGADEGCPVVGDDFTNYTLLLKEMREAFDAKYGAGEKKITTCSSVNINTIKEQDIASFAQYVNLINIMSYDMTGSYDPVTGHHTALNTTDPEGHSVVKGVDYFLEHGVPASKINIGSPLYCHGWGGVIADENGNVVGVPGSADGYTGDKNWNILKAIELLVVEDGEFGWHKGYDETSGAAYLWNDNPNSKYYKNFLTYESEESLKAKLDYIEEKGLAGMIVWEVGGDSAVDEYPMISQMAIGLGIYNGEQPVYGQAGQIPEIDDTVTESGYPDPMTETVAGDGSNAFPAGTYIYYKDAVWKATKDTNDWTDNLPDGAWGDSCWEKQFDVKKYVSQEELGYWDWAADAGEYVFYDPDKDSVGGIYLATAQTSNTANDAPDGIWGTNWKYITTVRLADAAPVNAIPDPMTETVVGDGSNVFRAGTYIYYKDAVWKSINDNSNDWIDNLPDGTWGASCWSKEFDVKKYVSQEELGYWDWAADAGEYVFYDPDKDGKGGIYLATAQTSNTANDAPDGIWGTNWEYVTTLILASQGEIEHDWDDDFTIDQEATCTEAGSKSIHCKECDEVKEVSVIPALGHDYEDAVTEPTETEQGYTTHTCTRCGDSYVDAYTDPIGGAEHDWDDDFTVDQEATCTEAGSKSIHCKDCDEVKEVTVIPALGHDYEDVVTAPTATEKGYTTHTCKRCGDSYVDAYTDPTGEIEHNWNSEFTVDKEATCTEAGSKSIHCKDCDKVKEVTAIPSLGHDYDKKVTAPTDTKKGYTTYTCKRCGETFKDNYTNATGAANNNQDTNTSGTKAPQTGDESNLGFWTMLMLCFGAASVMIGSAKFRKREQGNK